MFGGYLALKRQEEETVKYWGRLRKAYNKLKEIDKTNRLLSLISLPDEETALSKITLKLTPELMEQYKIDYQTFDQRIGVFGWSEEFVSYISDLELEVQKLEGSAR